MDFFDSWQSLAHTAMSGVLAYALVVVLLRTSGKRTLSKLNAFDLVVTVALGSTLASTMTSDRLLLANGLLALSLLISLQFIVAWLIARWRWLRGIIMSEPTLLFYGGEFIDSAIRNARLNRDESSRSSKAPARAISHRCTRLCSRRTAPSASYQCPTIRLYRQLSGMCRA